MQCYVHWKNFVNRLEGTGDNTGYLESPLVHEHHLFPMGMSLYGPLQSKETWDNGRGSQVYECHSVWIPEGTVSPCSSGHHVGEHLAGKESCLSRPVLRIRRMHVWRSAIDLKLLFSCWLTESRIKRATIWWCWAMLSSQLWSSYVDCGSFMSLAMKIVYLPKACYTSCE